MAGKLGYKFVNPALTGEEKDAVASAGLPVKKLPHSKLLLGLNRAGATTNSIYNLVKSLKGLEEVRAISLKEDEVDERRARRRAKDEAAETRQESPIIPKDEKEGMKDGEEKIKKNKKGKGLLEKIFGPILNIIAPFIKFIAITSTLKWFADPKNKEKVQRLVEFLGEIFKFLFQWGTFGVTNILGGLAKVFGGVGKFKEGNILGGAWDSMMGFGQLLVGLIALKGLALFLNPFKLMGGILDMLGVLGDDAASGGDCGPDVDKPGKPKGRKPKSFLQKLRQRARITVKRLRRYFSKALPLLMRQTLKLAKSFSARIGKLSANLLTKVAKPLIKTVIEGASKVIPPGAKKVIGEATQKVVKGAADILPAVTKRATDFKNWATRGIQTGIGFLKSKGSDVLKFAADKWKTLKDGAVASAQKIISGAKGLGDSVLKGAAALKDKGEKAVVEHILGPLKAQADNLIAKSPVLQKVLGLFKGAGKQGIGDAASSAFKKFLGFVKPVAEPLARTLKGLNLPVIDTVIEGLFALYDLKSGVPPVRVALKLGGSLAGLALGATVTGGATFFSGGLGAFLAPVLIGASQWGGEWLGDRVADMLGIPTNNNEKFGKGGIITERAIVEVAEAGEPEVIIPVSQLEQLIGANSSILPGAPYLVGGMASFADSLGQFPGVSDVKGELNTLSTAFDAAGFAVARDETIKNATVANVDAATMGATPAGGANLAALLAAMSSAMGGSEEENQQQGQGSGGGGDSGGGGGGGGESAAPPDSGGGGGEPVSGEFGKRVSALLGSYEGLRLEAYKDAIYGWGVPTIGIGATYYPPGFRLKGKVKRGDKITKDEAYWIKSKHVEQFISKIRKEVGGSVYDKLPEKVKAPLISKAFNYGSLGGTLSKLVKAGDIGAIASYFRKTLANHDGGINSWRRNDEAAVMTTGTSPRAKVSFASGGGSIGNVVIPNMTPSFSSGGSLEAMSIDQLKTMLDPTMPGAKNPAVFKAASEARRKYRSLGKQEQERRVLIATVRAMRGGSDVGPTTAPKISSPANGPTPGSALKQTSASVAKDKITEQENPAIIPIPSVTPVAINKGGTPSATTPRFAASGKTGMQHRFTAY